MKKTIELNKEDIEQIIALYFRDPELKVEISSDENGVKAIVQGEASIPEAYY